MTITYVIGDIHGCLKELLQLTDLCAEYHATYHRDETKKFVFIGDYIDRGPDSKGVIDYLTHLAEAYECVFLRGNHEDMLMNDPELCWMNGGDATFSSYGWDSLTPVFTADHVRQLYQDLVPEDHKEFFRNTRLFHIDTFRTYVHAGINRHVTSGSMHDQTKSVLLWVRHEFLEDPSMEGGYIVHGHTPCENGTEPALKPNRINLDTGCVFGGKLTAVVFNELKTEPEFIIQHTDRPVGV